MGSFIMIIRITGLLYIMLGLTSGFLEITRLQQVRLRVRLQQQPVRLQLVRQQVVLAQLVHRQVQVQQLHYEKNSKSRKWSSN